MTIFREDLHIGSKVALVETDDLRNNSITNEKLAPGSVSTEKLGAEVLSRLPASTDEVESYDTLELFPEQGEGGVIYIAKDTNKSYRWTGEYYKEIGSPLELGETPGTAFDGGAGHEHLVSQNNPHQVTKEQVGLGKVENFKAVSTEGGQELTEDEKANARNNIGASNFSGSYNDLQDKPNIYTKDETYSKEEVFNKSEVYDKGNVYNKTEVYNKGEAYNKEEVYNKNEVYSKSETYSKTQLDIMITTPQVQYVTVEATSETTDVHDVLPETGAGNTVYRVGSWDGTQYDVTKYTKYSWDGTDYVPLATESQVDEVFDISVYHATGGTPAQYADLAAALVTNGTINVPEGIRKGGMSVKFIQSTDGKYVQYRLTADEWSTNVLLWQGVAKGIIAGEHSLAESSDVYFNTFTKNLFNTNFEKNIGYWKASGSGQQVTNKEYECFTLRNLKGGIRYIFSGTTSCHICFYNNDTYLGGINDSASDHSFVLPANCNIVYVSIKIVEENLLQIELGDTATSYINGGSYVDLERDKAANGENINDKTTPITKLDSCIINKFNYQSEDKQEGYYRRYSDGSLLAQSSYACFHLYNLKAGKTYYITGTHYYHLCFYVEDFYISGNYEGNGFVFTVPAYSNNCYLSIRMVDYKSVQVVEEDNAPYVSYDAPKLPLSSIYNGDKINKSLYANSILYKKTFDAAVLDEDYTDATIDNFTADGLLINSTNAIRLNKMYAVAHRVMRLMCKFAENTSFKVASSSGDSTLIINVATGIISCNDVITQTDILNATDLYVVEILQDYQVGKITVANLKTSASVEITATRNGVGGVGGGATGEYNAGFGLWHYYYQFSLTASGGSCLIKDINICAGDDNYDVVFFGDSITEEESYYPTEDFQKSWTQLAIANSKKKCVTSAISGYGQNELSNWIKNELPYLNTKYAVITIGTNGGVTESVMIELLSYIISLGVIPILNNIPCNEHNTQTSVNNIIKSLRKQFKINGARFDLCTSVNLNGITVDTSKMYWEEYGGTLGNIYHHPNVKGSMAMFKQLLIDCPELF